MTTVPLKKKGRRSSEIGRLGLECEFVEYDNKQSHVKYTINLRCQANSKEWKIHKRYSDFYQLNNKLQRDRNFRGIKLPSLPPKSVSLTEQSKKELVQMRMSQLQDYLSQLISRTVFLSSAAVRKFLEMPSSVKDAAVLLAERQNEPLKRGYMEKKGAVNKKWRKRWFVMQPNSILKYYKEQISTEPQGSIDISTILTIVSKEVNADKKHSFALKARDRVWWLACENEQEKREWVRLFMRLKDTKAPPKLNTTEHRPSLNLGPHFKTVSRIAWSPTIPGICATGSKDESVKVWLTHLLDNTLIPPSFQNTNEYSDDEDDILNKNNNNNENNNITTKGSDETKTNSDNNNTNSNKNIYPLHAIEFRPIAEFKTSGEVTALEWSPDGTMLVVSLKKEKIINNNNNNSNENDNNTENNNKQVERAFFIQCFDIAPIVGNYFDDDNDDHSMDSQDLNSSSQQQRTKIFTLQDHPSHLSFSNDSNRIYMAMDIDPNSEENEKRRPAFLVYLDLQQNQLHRCKTVDRVIDHQTEFIAALSMNNDRSLMVVGTCTHQGQGRLIAWDVDKNETRLIERQGVRISSMTWTEDDSWLIIGRINGTVEFWHVFNENNKKYKFIQKNRIKNNSNNKSLENNENSNNNNNSSNNDKNNSDKEDNTEVEDEPDVSNFDKTFVQKAHSGEVFNLTTSNGVLITSARLSNKEYESFFCDNLMFDIRGMMNYGLEPKIISTLHNVNENDNDITRLLALSPVTPRHVREGGGPGTLLAASGDCAIFCHNMMDVILDAISTRQNNKS